MNPKIAIEAGNIVIEWHHAAKKQQRIFLDPTPEKLDRWIPDLQQGYGHQMNAGDLRERIDKLLAAAPKKWDLANPPKPPDRP